MSKNVKAAPMACHGNLQKHTSRNPLQRYLLQRFHRQVIRLLAASGAQKILDAGCGEGFTIRALERSRILSPTTQLVGIDLSWRALTWRQAASSAVLLQADIEHLPFRDASFDMVYCLEVLEHLSSPAVALHELLRVSRCYVLVSVPHEPFFRIANFLRGKHIRAWGNDPEHIQNYRGAGFRRLLRSQGELCWHGYCFPWQLGLVRPNR